MTCQAHSTFGTPSSFIPSISSALCCCYTFHLIDCTPPSRRRPSPVCTTPIPSPRMLIPVNVTPLFVVCLSAPVLHANYVAQFLFLFFNRPQAGSALPLASDTTPSYTQRMWTHRPSRSLPLWLITARQSAMRPCPSVMPAPSGRRLDGDHAHVSAHVKLYLPLHPNHDAWRPPLTLWSAWVWLPKYNGLALLIWTTPVHCGLVLPKKNGISQEIARSTWYPYPPTWQRGRT